MQLNRRIVQDEKKTPRNQQTKQELDQTRFTFVVTFIALGSLGHDKLVE
jgi:hypothetical protein